MADNFVTEERFDKFEKRVDEHMRESRDSNTRILRALQGDLDEHEKPGLVDQVRSNTEFRKGFKVRSWGVIMMFITMMAVTVWNTITGKK